MENNFIFDEVIPVSNTGLILYKTREIKEDKTIFRVIEVEGKGHINEEFLSLLFKQYEGSILKIYKSFQDWKESFAQVGIRVILIPDIKGDKFFDDRWERVKRFVTKNLEQVA